MPARASDADVVQAVRAALKSFISTPRLVDAILADGPVGMEYLRVGYDAFIGAGDAALRTQCLDHIESRDTTGAAFLAALRQHGML
jgi:hypothetical protein